MKNEKILNINDRDYKIPEKNVTVICLDGSDPSYLEIAISQGYMPNLKKIIKGDKMKIELIKIYLFMTVWPPPRTQRFSGSEASDVSLETNRKHPFSWLFVCEDERRSFISVSRDDVVDSIRTAG